MDTATLEVVKAKVDAWVAKLDTLAKHHWKGNDAPNVHHFDEGTIVPSATVDMVDQAVYIKFEYADNGTAHVVEAITPLTQLGKTGPNENITLDGAPMRFGSFVLGHREGLDESGLYCRMVVEFRFTDLDGKSHNLRFDGDL